jgi:hypothetical protein
MPAPTRSAAVQALIAQRFPDAIPVERWSRGTVPTGVEALDRILPNGGFQRGRLAVWMPGAGATALLRTAALRAVADGERAVWIDATCTVTGACWREGPLLVRPSSESSALRAAEELSRSGGFAFVVLDSVEPQSPELVRCARAAHEGGVALVLVTRAASIASLRLSSEVAALAGRWAGGRAGGPDRRSVCHATEAARVHCPPARLPACPPVIRSIRVKVTARASGWHASTELALPVTHDDLRLSLELRYPDRRGVRR